VHDFDQRRDFDRPDHARNTSRNNGDYELSARQPMHSNMGNDLTGIETRL
jgi:hypothetical protein